MLRFGFLLLSFHVAHPAVAQEAGTGASPEPVAAPARQLEEVELLGLSVEGVSSAQQRSLIAQVSGLAPGQKLSLPGDPRLSEAIRTVYRLGLFSQVRILEERRVGAGVYVTLAVDPVPVLADYRLEGVKKRHRDDLNALIPLMQRRPVHPDDLGRAMLAIERYFVEKGHRLATVTVHQTIRPDSTLDVVFDVDRGPIVQVEDIEVEGNAALSDAGVRRRMKTKQRTWWRFWKKETFQEPVFEQDLHRIVAAYNERGFYDAQVVHDTVSVVDNDEPAIRAALEIQEGVRYHIRTVAWEGNTLFSDAFLTQTLGLYPGDVYDGSRLEENLYGNKRSSDVSSHYLNRGYLRFHVEPTIRVVGADSLDLHFDIFEGDTYQFGKVGITGNLKTRDHVIRRELYTLPGEDFSRESIQESVRRLMQLSYFSQESVAAGPTIDIDEADKQVNLTYNLEEVSSDNVQLSGTWASTGLILQLGFTFTNFAIADLLRGRSWRPLPSGDGQQLSLNLQTSGVNYQSYSVSFTEPWFKGKPRPFTVGLSYSHLDALLYGIEGGALNTFLTYTSFDRRLQWPDSFFSLSTGVRFQVYDNGIEGLSVPTGLSRELVFRQGISRNSLDHPVFPMAGSAMQLSLDVSPPLPGFVQYHKWRFSTEWNMALSKQVSLGVAARYGYIGSLTGAEVAFQRFLVGGSPFDTQGVNTTYGQDIVYMRGYPARSIGPQRDGIAVGGRILNKYTSELRWMAVQAPTLTAMPYLFLDAANTWDGFSSFNPARLYRSAGVGVRLSVPLLGLVELNYGYGMDPYTPTGNQDGSPGWLFQFTLGQTLGR